jgi:hypothetical protein
MAAAQIADVAVGDIDNRRGDPLAVPVGNLDDLLVNQGLFAPEFFPFRLLDLLECHFVDPS